MISIQEAYRTIIDHTPLARVVNTPLENALHTILSASIQAPLSLPPFDNSAVDGYAIGAGVDLTKAEHSIVFEVPAGDTVVRTLPEGSVARIFTGAPIPEGTEGVIMQELTTPSEAGIRFKENTPFRPGQHIRRMGEEVQLGDELLQTGWKVNAATIGFLASLGLNEIQTFELPKITLVSTGNELVAPGQNLRHGEIYESNSAMLDAALRNLPVQSIKRLQLTDQLASTQQALEQALRESEIVIFTGGISVGKYDYVRTALETSGVKNLFYKVRQKPGKPMFFGKRKNTLIFALPGNPAAALTCFYRYIRPSIRKHIGEKNFDPVETEAALTKDFLKKGDRAFLLKAKLSGNQVDLLDGQSSSMLHSFAKANALVYLPEGEKQYTKGDQVLVHPL